MKSKPKKPVQPPLTRLSEKISAGLQKVYNKMPTNSFLDRPTTALILLCVIGYLAFIGAVYFSSPPLSSLQTQLEPQLTPAVMLQLHAGELYVYQLSTPSDSALVRYAVRAAAGCKGLQVEDSTDGSLVCISSQGRLVGEDMPSNFSLGNRSIVLFEPWMLSVSNSSDWTIENRISAAGTSVSMFSYVRCTGEETVGGRRAFKVETGIEGGRPVRIFVDEEKRVLLLAEAENVSIRLVSAPFALNWTSIPQN